MRARSNPTPSDPVCGRALPSNGEYPAVVNGGAAYYSCSQACLNRFNRERARFVRPARKGLRGM